MATTPQDAAKASAPAAQVTPQQPAQQPAPAAAPAAQASAPAAAPANTQSGSNGQTGDAAASQSAASNGGSQIQPTMKTDGGEVNRGTAASDMAGKMKSGNDEDKGKLVDQGREEEQKVGKELDEANANSDYFQQVANDDAVFNDQSRQEHRAMRLREQEEKLGDPTRDPVAKQKVMDMNTPVEGAAEEAEQINKGESAPKRS